MRRIWSSASATVFRGVDYGAGVSSPPRSGLSFTFRTLAGSQYCTEHLQITVEPLAGDAEGVSVLSICRAEARNAIGRQLLRELQEAINILRQERTTRCLVIRSAVPGVFCAGADLKERATMTKQEATEFVNNVRKTFSEVEALPMPTLAVVEGHALGGGAELALACDIRISDETSTFAFPETQLGIIPGAGGTQRLPRLVGRSKAKELVFTCERISASEAQAIGLIDHLVPPLNAYDKALTLSKRIAKAAPLSLRAAKAAINQGLDVDQNNGCKIEEALYSQLIHTQDRLEGLKAFIAKRRPNFTGE